MKCPKGQILRKGYIRKSYIRRDGTRVSKTRVSPACIIDRGRKGKGPYTLPSLDPNIRLRDYGYSSKKEPIERKKALKRASRELGTLPTLRRLNLIANYNKWNPDVESEMRRDVEFLKKEYSKEKARNMRKQSRSKNYASRSKNNSNKRYN